MARAEERSHTTTHWSSRRDQHIGTSALGHPSSPFHMHMHMVCPVRDVCERNVFFLYIFFFMPSFRIRRHAARRWLRLLLSNQNSILSFHCTFLILITISCCKLYLPVRFVLRVKRSPWRRCVFGWRRSGATAAVGRSAQTSMHEMPPHTRTSTDQIRSE